jgi:hypothetical protein
MTWTAWSALTPAEQQALPKVLITDAPGVDGPINIDLITKLWENPNPNSAFTPQQITLSSNDYDLLLVLFNSHLDMTIYARSSTIITKGAHSYLSQSFCNTSSIKCTSRFIEFYNQTTYNVDNGYTIDSGGTISQENKCCVPIAIYGIKSSVTIDVSGIIADVSTDADKCMMSDGVTSVEDAIDELAAKPSITIAGIFMGSANNYVTINYNFPTNIKTVTITKVFCLGINSQTVSIPCTIARHGIVPDVPAGTVLVYALVSDDTLASNIRAYASSVVLELTYN